MTTRWRDVLGHVSAVVNLLLAVTYAVGWQADPKTVAQLFRGETGVLIIPLVLAWPPAQVIISIMRALSSKTPDTILAKGAHWLACFVSLYNVCFLLTRAMFPPSFQ